MQNLESLPIRSAQGNYEVEFIPSLQTLAQSLQKIPNSVTIIDRAVASTYRQPLAPALQNRPVLEVSATEEAKTPSGVLAAWEFFQKSNATKSTELVVIGGGIIQDIAQFAAHNYYRGIRWHFIPTTLLAQADSCIGGKCGINLGPYKNQLGVFHSPSRIGICLEFLKTLSDADVCSGYGEILKLHLTRSSAEWFSDLVANVNQGGWRNPQLSRLIRQSLEVKRGVIEEDEYERDLRRILNYGHTFGHALESISRHQIPHGIAVAWGIDLVNYIAWQTGRIPEKHFETVHQFIETHFKWRLKEPVKADDLIHAIRRDKKVENTTIYLILPAKIGSLQIVPFPLGEELSSLVGKYLKNYHVVHWD